MRRLKLFPELPQAAIMECAPLAQDSQCTRCPAHEGARTRCMAAEGKPGGLLVVGEAPSKVEDQIGRPYSAGTGRYLRSVLQRWWQGPIALDNAVRCRVVGDIKDKLVTNCRPYGATVLKEVRPKRIVCLGNAAVLSILGHRPPIMSARRGYGFVFDELDDPIPVFMLPNPALAVRNRFHQKDFERDLQWALTVEAPQPDIDGYTYLVEDEQDAREAYAALKLQKWVAYDVETFGKSYNRDFRIESSTFEGPSSEAAYTWTRAALRDPGALKYLRKILESARIGKVTQNGKYDDRSMLCAYGIQVRNVRFDTRLGRKLLEPEADAKLDTLAYLVGLGGHKHEADDALLVIEKELKRIANPPTTLTSKGKHRKGSLEVTPPAFDVSEGVIKQLTAGEDARAFSFGYLDAQTLYRYNARDVHVTLRDSQLLEDRLKKDPQLYRIWDQVTRKANDAVRYMEHWGIAADQAAVLNFSIYCQTKVDESLKQIRQYEPDLNLNSPKQVGNLLFNKLGLSPIKETATGANSTDNEVLEALASKHPAVAAIVQHRHYAKLQGTYAEGMLPHIRDDGRIHPSFLIDGTRTGRFSCADPNLQNIPRAEGDADASMARNCFVAVPGRVLLELDFSQIELRIAAMLANDLAMIKDFKRGIDIHMHNATLSCQAAFGISRQQWDAMSKEAKKPYRSKIKTATFAKLYGKSAGALAREWGVAIAQVDAILQAVWGKYTRLDAWTREQISAARRQGFVETWWDGEPGLRRPIYKIADPDEQVRKHAENEAVNSPVQGTAAHFTAASLPLIVDWVLEDMIPAKVILTVHDSIMLEVKESFVDEVAIKCREIMCGHNSLGVPIEVEAKVGYAWGSMTEYSFSGGA